VDFNLEGDCKRGCEDDCGFVVVRLRIILSRGLASLSLVLSFVKVVNVSLQ